MSKVNLEAIMAVTSDILLHASLVEQSRSIVYIHTGLPALDVSEINELSERITIKNNVNSIDINIKTHTLDMVLYVPDILPDFIINDEEEKDVVLDMVHGAQATSTV